MAGRVDIKHYAPERVMSGLLEGADYRNRVGGSCVYACPRCAHRIRFRWRSFLNADGRSPLKAKLRRAFDDLTPQEAGADRSLIDFHCPTCAAPTRIIYQARQPGTIAPHFDIYAVLAGESQTQA